MTSLRELVLTENPMYMNTNYVRSCITKRIRHTVHDTSKNFPFWIWPITLVATHRDQQQYLLWLEYEIMCLLVKCDDMVHTSVRVEFLYIRKSLYNWSLIGKQILQDMSWSILVTIIRLFSLERSEQLQSVDCNDTAEPAECLHVTVECLGQWLVSTVECLLQCRVSGVDCRVSTAVSCVRTC